MSFVGIASSHTTPGCRWPPFPRQSVLRIACLGVRSVGGQITVGAPAKRLPREVRHLVGAVIARGLTERAWRTGNRCVARLRLARDLVLRVVYVSPGLSLLSIP